MATIAAVLIVKDEAEVLGRCLASLAWVDEIVVVIDAGSRDDSQALAEAAGAKVLVRAFDRFDNQRNAGTDASTSDWILTIDADEQVPPALAAEIRRVIEQPDAREIYGIPFCQQIFGRWPRHGSWGDPLYRLYRRHVRWHHAVHERVGEDQPRGVLVAPLLHYSHRSIGEFLTKLNRYTDEEAAARVAEGQRYSPAKLILSPVRDFWRRYVLQRGYRDGAVGLVLAGLMAVYIFVVRAKAWELTRGADEPAPVEVG